MTTTRTNTEALEDAITRCMSPEGVTMLISLLQNVGNYRNDETDHDKAIREVVWFRCTMLNLVGVDEFNATIDELGL
jgi:hypothetical protein